jgi:glutathione S-transferase
MSADEKRGVLTGALDRLAAALDAQGGINGHLIGDSLTFADVAAAAYVEWFTVITNEADHVLSNNGGRWKELLAEVKS